ncbi:hypothetical protein [Mesorhizobium sp. M1272]|uniref:antibiotic biosynthesis monooxygenase family protein n=1 Tax=Mesorhizobium sp. M1272 TaxID=2957074 RepID=UPI00333D8640
MIAVISEVWPHPDRCSDYETFAKELRPLLEAIDGFLENDVTEIDPNTVKDSAVLRFTSVSLCHRPLDFDSALNRLNDARELYEQAVARGLDDIAPMRRDPGPDDLTNMYLQARKRAGFVHLHHPAVAGDIRGKGRRKLPLAKVGQVNHTAAYGSGSPFVELHS